MRRQSCKYTIKIFISSNLCIDLASSNTPWPETSRKREKNEVRKEIENRKTKEKIKPEVASLK